MFMSMWTAITKYITFRFLKKYAISFTFLNLLLEELKIFIQENVYLSTLIKNIYAFEGYIYHMCK